MLELGKQVGIHFDIYFVYTYLIYNVFLQNDN